MLSPDVLLSSAGRSYANDISEVANTHEWFDQLSQYNVKVNFFNKNGCKTYDLHTGHSSTIDFPTEFPIYKNEGQCTRWLRKFGTAEGTLTSYLFNQQIMICNHSLIN